jgi:hypothetical protein
MLSCAPRTTSYHRRYWFYLFDASRKTAKDVERLLNHESGLTRSGLYSSVLSPKFWGVVHSRFTIYDLLVGAHPSFVRLPIIPREFAFG